MICEGEWAASLHRCSQHHGHIVLCLVPRHKAGAGGRIFSSLGSLLMTTLPARQSTTTGGYGLEKNGSMMNPVHVFHHYQEGVGMAEKHETAKGRSGDSKQWLQRLPALLPDTEASSSYQTHARSGEASVVGLHAPSSHVTLEQLPTEIIEKNIFVVVSLQKQNPKPKSQQKFAVFLSLWVLAQPGDISAWQPALLGLTPNGQWSVHCTEMLGAPCTRLCRQRWWDLLHNFCFSQSATDRAW